MNMLKPIARIFIILIAALLIIMATFSITQASGITRSTSSAMAQTSINAPTSLRNPAAGAASNVMQSSPRGNRNAPNLLGLTSVGANLLIISVIVLPFAWRARRKQARKLNVSQI